MPCTADDFKRATGREPQQDDLERVNCDQVGEIGHMTCGWCHTHNAPAFWCECWQQYPVGSRRVFID